MKLTEKEQGLLRDEVQVLQAAADPALKDRYAAVSAAVNEAEVPERHLGLFSQVLEFLLDSGRVIDRYGAEGEQALLRLYQKTPRGQELARGVAELNRALQVLQGQAIEEVTFTARGPGRYRLGIGTDRCEIAVGIDKRGLAIEGLEVGI
jgi:hypothetical protein